MNESINKRKKEEIQRLLKLQENFENGLIAEEEISEEDTKKLHKIYDLQINKIEEATEKCKNEIVKIREDIKKLANKK